MEPPDAIPPPPPGHADRLEMIRPSAAPALVPPLPPGYRLRTLRADEQPQYEALFRLGFDAIHRMPEILEKTLPDGCVVIEHAPTGRLVASCRAFAGNRPPRHRNAGQLAWLVADPAHARQRLGTIVAAAITNRLVRDGYQAPFLRTEDPLLPAISLYLRLGWQPSLYTAEMPSRWQRILAALGRDKP
jgi:mycothiol synthase